MQRLLTDYGMVLVLAGLCVLFSLLTLKQQVPEGQAAAVELARQVQSRIAKTDVVIAVGADEQGHGCAGRERGAGAAGRAVMSTYRLWWERRASCVWHWTTSRGRGKPVPRL